MEALLLIRCILLFFLVSLYTRKSVAEDAAAKYDYEVCNSKQTTKEEIDSTEAAIMQSVKTYRSQLDSMKNEIDEKLKEVDKNQEKVKRLEETNDNSITVTQLRDSILKLGQDIEQIKSDGIEKTDELQTNLMIAEKSLRKKIVCVEEVGYKSMSLKYKNLSTKTLSCGGVIVGHKEGLLQFRSNETFSKYRKCIWTLRIENYAQMKLQILADTFTENDFVMITDINKQYYKSFDDNGSAVQYAPGRGSITLSANGTVIKHGDRNEFNFYGPYIFISFATKNYNEGSGFLLKFQGVENSSLSHIFRNVSHINEHSNNLLGLMKYPKHGLYPYNAFGTFVVNPPINSEDDSNKLRAKLEYIDIEFDLSCDSDVLEIYNYDLAKNSLVSHRYCDEEGSPQHPDELTSLDGAFIVTFISDDIFGAHANDTRLEIKSNHKGFRFSWKTSV